MITRIRTFVFGFAITISSVVFAQDGTHAMRWASFQYNDDTNQGRATSTISFGVPETDNVMVNGTCTAGSNHGISQLTFAGPVFDLPLKSRISIQILGDQYTQSYLGEVYYSQSGEGIGGVRLKLKHNDPLWEVLKGLANISYQVNGQVFQVSLRGSSRAINSYLSHCRSYASAVVTLATNLPEPSNDPRHATCDILRNNVSRNSDIPVTVTFVNRSDGHRGVLWVGFDGVPKDYAALDPGQKFTINTFATHPWMFTDGPGNCLEMFMPQPGVTQFNITAPGRYFGDE